jgi:hypothetical protein
LSKFVGWQKSFLAMVLIGLSFCFTLILVFKFSFVFSIFVLALVKVLVNFGLRLFGESFGQINLAKIFSSALFMAGFVGSQNWLNFFGQSFWLIVVFIWSASL